MPSDYKPHALLLSWSVAKHSRGVGYAPVVFTRKNEKKAVKSTPSDAARKIAVGAGLTALSSRHTISCNLYHVQWPVNIDTTTYVVTTNQKTR